MLKRIFYFLSQPVGCDLIVNSSVRKDRCGICDGDNSTCDVIQNTFTAQPRKNSKTIRGYNCIKNFHLGKSIDGYLVENLELRCMSALS